MSNVYKFVKNPGEKEKLAPQARTILGHIEAAGANGINRDQLKAKLDADVKSGKLETRQDTSKLIGFYQGRMVEDGFITMTKLPKEVKEKPVKGEAKPAATVGQKKAEPVPA